MVKPFLNPSFYFVEDMKFFLEKTTRLDQNFSSNGTAPAAGAARFDFGGQVGVPFGAAV